MSVPRPHDLLWGMTPAQLPSDAPAWAHDVLVAGQPVVVRRARCAEGWVAVGVRGQGRERRLAAQMPCAAVMRRLSPEDLRWHGDSPLPALQALAQVSAVLDASGLPWGPTGGVAYQLATGESVLHPGSDLDLLLRTPKPMPRQQAQALLSRLDAARCRIDLQLETPEGAVALREWAGSARRVLLKSPRGARLVLDPWNRLECAA
ncbi:malonate decarboxylase holo-ACP synthase [Pseudomonas entomophila]|uniref:malonate decarboxylase holo-ACP synthase n=1 Tax=Pseudomonas entomophila TaxID=312306 RepID=UPI0023D8440D|nr:malonate decarboxylase holo-ACP synthase [Pseudomonas entomophila]MDF0732868.1 malonate decarboxylase holo-ACP synthase [Pseudomonas entomophila]